MMLKKIQINNFRSFENAEIDFNRYLTVLVGKNGTGKTTILEAAAIAAGTLFSSLNGVSNVGIKKDDAHYKYFDMGSVVDVQPQFPVDVSAWGKIEGEDVCWKRSLHSDTGKTTVVDAKAITKISESYQMRLMSGDTTLIMPFIAYYGTGRLWDQHREKKKNTLKKNTRTNGYIDSLDGSANVKLMLKWFERMSLKDGQRDVPSPEYAAVRTAMEKCFISIMGCEEAKVQYNPDTEEIDIIYRDNEKGRVRMPINQLSDGYRCALSLIADIAYRMATLNPQLSGKVLTETDGIALIDEIDLHLHPAWQQRILSDLRKIFPKLQFIVTTHAPAVINSVKSENIVILEDGCIREPNGEVYGKDVNTIIEGVMDANVRPESVLNSFNEFYIALKNKEYDKAKKIIHFLENEIGSNDSEIVSCNVKLKLNMFDGGGNAENK